MNGTILREKKGPPRFLKGRTNGGLVRDQEPSRCSQPAPLDSPLRGTPEGRQLESIKAKAFDDWYTTEKDAATITRDESIVGATS